MKRHSVTCATVCRDMVTPQHSQAVLGSPDAAGVGDISILEKQFGWKTVILCFVQTVYLPCNSIIKQQKSTALFCIFLSLTATWDQSLPKSQHISTFITLMCPWHNQTYFWDMRTPLLPLPTVGNLACCNFAYRVHLLRSSLNSAFIWFGLPWTQHSFGLCCRICFSIDCLSSCVGMYSSVLFYPDCISILLQYLYSWYDPV
jgi:hypothetical protein